MATKKTHEKNNDSKPWMVLSFVLLAVVFLFLIWNVAITTLFLLGGDVMADSGSQKAPTQAAPNDNQPTAPTQPGAVAVSADDDPVKGDPNAPVEIIEFSDYECPFCGRFYTDSLGPIMDEYVATGKVKFVFRDFPLSFHARAVPSAIAAECVQELAGDEAYFDYHDLLFSNQGNLADAALRSHAETIGVDLGDWDDCYADEDGKMAAEVNADFKAGQAAGVSGTPTLFINGNKIVGAQPFSVFKAAIDAELQ